MSGRTIRASTARQYRTFRSDPARKLKIKLKRCTPQQPKPQLGSLVALFQRFVFGRFRLVEEMDVPESKAIPPPPQYNSCQSAYRAPLSGHIGAYTRLVLCTAQRTGGICTSFVDRRLAGTALSRLRAPVMPGPKTLCQKHISQSTCADRHCEIKQKTLLPGTNCTGNVTFFI
eukprot:1804714-Rhodomonas_salina.2